MLGESDLDVSDLLRADRPGVKRSEATAWLAQLLASGSMPVEWIRKAAEEAGYAWRTVERAKGELSVRSERVGGIGGKGRWEWTL
jgi:putative DNA primase/helicase